MNEFKSWNSYRDFAHSVRRKRRYVRSQEDEEFLREVLKTSEARIKQMKAGFGLWRAQLGHGWRSAHQDGENLGEVPCAYPPKRMKPIPDRAKEGRANPKGIPFLYLSTRKETAMSEIRPWIGSLISCAHFRTTKDLKIIDLSVYHGKGFMFYFEEPDARKKEEAVWTQIDQAFSTPLTSDDDVADYVPTQVIAELFKSEGYDGIAYKSTFGENGYNVALFNLDDAKVTSCVLQEVKNVQFNFEQIDNPYWVEPDGTIKSMTIEVLSPANET
jgi:RES domain-containing protein